MAKWLLQMESRLKNNVKLQGVGSSARAVLGSEQTDCNVTQVAYLAAGTDIALKKLFVPKIFSEVARTSPISIQRETSSGPWKTDTIIKLEDTEQDIQI